MPELVSQEPFGPLNQVYQTGKTYYAHDQLVQLDYANDDRRELEKRYYEFICQARRNAAGVIDGIFTFGYDVSARVRTRQQTEHLNAELANANEELQAANEELIANNKLVYSYDAARAADQGAGQVQVRTRAAELARPRPPFEYWP